MGDTGQGNENVGVQDLAIPRIDIIQDLSPQHKENKPEYIEGAKPGVAFNTITNRLYGEAVYVVPVYYRGEYVIWKDQDHGGGFRGAFPTLAEAETELQNLEDAALCEIVETKQQFVLVVHPESTADEPVLEQAVMSMSKSKLKPNRTWNTMIQTSGNDRFSRMYKLSAVEAQNAKKQDYYNWRVDQLGYVPESIYEAAKKFYEAVSSGELDVSRKPAGEGSQSSGAGSEPAGGDFDPDSDEF
jgi:hypothetical protein